MGINTTALYCELRNCTLQQYYNDILNMAEPERGGANPGTIRDLIFCAIKDGYRKHKEDMPEGFDNYEVGDHMDDISKKDITAFLVLLVASLPKADPDEKKKAVTAKK